MDLGSWMLHRSYGTKTIRQYTRNISRVQQWLLAHNRPPLGTDPMDLSAYAQTLPLTYASRNIFRCALKAFYESQEWGEPPLWAVPCPKPPRPVCKAVERDELDRILRAARSLSPRHWYAVCCMYYAALRREETAVTRFEDFQGDRLKVVGKGLKQDSVKVHPILADAVAQLRGVGWCLPGRTPGSHISPATLNTWTSVIGAWAQVPDLTPHRLRHTALAQANDVTGRLRAVADFARHSNIQTTMVYTRTLSVAEDEVLAAL